VTRANAVALARCAGLALLLATACGDDAPSATDAGGFADATPGDASVDGAPDDARTDAATDAGEDAPRPPPFVGPTGSTEGCGRAAEAGTTVRSIDVRGTERSFRLAVPEGYDPDAPHALVFVWHGLGGSASNFQRLMRMETTAGGAAIAVYPQGLPRVGDADGWDLDDDGEDVALFDAVYAEIASELCIDRARVFSTGFSHGGFMSNLLGCVRGDVVRAIAPIAGASAGRRCTGQVAAWLVHGTADLVVVPNLGKAARGRWLVRNGCSREATPTTPEGCSEYLGCDEGYPVVWCEHSGPHTVPAWVPAAAWGFFDGLD